jgi:heptosyltransferase-3
MRILFIKLRHIGDSLLLTPTLLATKQKHPHAEIWVLVRRTCDGILAGCPEIDLILVTANPDAAKRSKRDWLSDLKLAALHRHTKFDHVFELTDNDRLLDDPPPELARRGCGEGFVSGGIDAGDSAQARARRLR